MAGRDVWAPVPRERRRWLASRGAAAGAMKSWSFSSLAAQPRVWLSQGLERERKCHWTKHISQRKTDNDEWCMHTLQGVPVLTMQQVTRVPGLV